MCRLATLGLGGDLSIGAEGNSCWGEVVMVQDRMSVSVLGKVREGASERGDRGSKQTGVEGAGTRAYCALRKLQATGSQGECDMRAEQ